MSNSEAKRRVMGRIELAHDASSPSVRHSASSSTSNGIRKGANVRAKVDMSSFSTPSPQSQTSSTPTDISSQSQQYFNRPKRPNDSTSHNGSPFLSPGQSSSLSASPNAGVRSSAFASTSSPHTPRIVRSPSPVRQLQRNPPSANDVSSTYLNGPVKVAKERSSAAPTIGHARVNSSQISAVVGEVNGRGHGRTQSSVSPFANGNSHGRSRIESANSSLLARSRSPSPSEARSYLADRRISQSSTASSAISVSSRQAATVPARAQRTASTTSRPPLNMAFSSYSSTQSPELVSPSLPSPSIAATIAKLPPYRESSVGESSSQGLPKSTSTEQLAPQAQDAKKNRKILDLEITNKSLLAINSGLEVVKLQQAREIRELKRRLREGKTIDTSISLGTEGDDDDDDEEDDSQTLEEEGTIDLELEQAHGRCKNLIDAMVNQARESILYKYEMDPKHKGASRVLHPAEVEEQEQAGSLSVSPLPEPLP